MIESAAIQSEQYNPKIQTLDGAPDFAYLVADRVTNPYQDMDCIILIVGRKRSGKSTTAVALAEEISVDIAAIKGNSNPKDFFDVKENVISVSRMGGLDLFTSHRATRNNQVFVFDDAKINLGAKKFNSAENQLQSDIATICGPFKHVLIYTMVFRKTLDKDSRELADFIIQIQGSDPFTKQTRGKIFYYETNDNGDEYKKHLRWTDPTTGIVYRIKEWIGTLPSEEILRTYNNMRRNGSVRLIEEARAQVDEIRKRRAEVKLRPSDLREIWVTENKEKVKQMRAGGMSIRAISRDLNKPVSTIEKCLTKVV